MNAPLRLSLWITSVSQVGRTKVRMLIIIQKQNTKRMFSLTFDIITFKRIKLNFFLLKLL